jgi:hypothetical protein
VGVRSPSVNLSTMPHLLLTLGWASCHIKPPTGGWTAHPVTGSGRFGEALRAPSAVTAAVVFRRAESPVAAIAVLHGHDGRGY